MKTILLICITLFTFSCKKDRTCTCNYENPSNGQPAETKMIIHDTKKRAQAQCDDIAHAYRYYNGTCKLK